MTAQTSAHTNSYANLPFVNFYSETFDFWKKNYDNFVESARELQFTYGAKGFGEGREQGTGPLQGAIPAYQAALATWQKAILELFGDFIRAISRLTASSQRLGGALKLQDQILHSRSITELGSGQATFFRRFADDFIKETEKLTRPVIRAKPDGAGTPSA